MVLEFNTRFGDPETQAILLRMETDILDLFNASIDGTANQPRHQDAPRSQRLRHRRQRRLPRQIRLRQTHPRPARSSPAIDVVVFHSGTAIKDGQLVTAGGRVLAITAMAPDLRTALDLAYAQLAKISFEGMQFRRDIGHRALNRKLNLE